MGEIVIIISRIFNSYLKYLNYYKVEVRSLTKLSNLFETVEANLCSPASSEMRKTYSGAFTWFDLWVRPEREQVYIVYTSFQLTMDYKKYIVGWHWENLSIFENFLPNCWMALSALQGNSRVTCTRLFWFSARLSAWREIPELAASDIMATFCQQMKASIYHMHNYKWSSNSISKSNSDHIRHWYLNNSKQSLKTKKMYKRIYLKNKIHCILLYFTVKVKKIKWEPFPHP